MHHVTISEAARLTGKARSTLQRHIKKGQISAKKDDNGHAQIDVAELERAYGSLRSPDGNAPPATVEQAGANATHEIDVLQVQLRHERERREKAETENERLLKIVESQTRLLEAPKVETKKKNSFWDWFTSH